MKPLRDDCDAIIQLVNCFGHHLPDAPPEFLNSCRLNCSSAGCLDPNHKLPVASKEYAAPIAAL